MDFTTRAARNADCLREVALNRRLAPDVYLGVAPLSSSAWRGRARRAYRARRWRRGRSEHCVVMRRLPDGRDALSCSSAARSRLPSSIASRCASRGSTTSKGSAARALRAGRVARALHAPAGPTSRRCAASRARRAARDAVAHLRGRHARLRARARGSLRGAPSQRPRGRRPRRPAPPARLVRARRRRAARDRLPRIRHGAAPHRRGVRGGVPGDGSALSRGAGPGGPLPARLRRRARRFRSLPRRGLVRELSRRGAREGGSDRRSRRPRSRRSSASARRRARAAIWRWRSRRWRRRAARRSC